MQLFRPNFMHFWQLKTFWNETKVLWLACRCFLIFVVWLHIQLPRSNFCSLLRFFFFMHACVCVCMYACMHVCAYVCMHACMCVRMYVCMHACVRVCMSACMHVCAYVCMYVCMCICLSACLPAYLSIVLYLFMCVYLFLHIIAIAESGLRPP